MPSFRVGQQKKVYCTSARWRARFAAPSQSLVGREFDSRRGIFLCAVYFKKTGSVRLGGDFVFVCNVTRGLDTLETRHWEAILFSYGTMEGIVAYAETSETRWWRPWFRTLKAATLVYPGL